MDVERLKAIAKSAASAGGARRKKPVARKAAGVDDKKLQSTLKRLGVNQIPGIEEVNLFQGEDVIHFANPRVQASIHANTYVVSGASTTRKAAENDMMNGAALQNIISQLGPDFLKQMQQGGGAEGDDEMPDVASFDTK